MSIQEHRTVVGSLALFAAGLGLLGAGNFVYFSYAEGRGSEQWILPLGYAAAALGVAGVVVAWQDRTARLLLAAALVVLDVILVWQVATNLDFRFVWEAGEGELVYLQVVLGLIALTLIATALQPARTQEAGPKGTPGAGRWMVRAVAYLGATLLTAYVVAMAGIAHHEDDCAGYDGDCFAALAGLVWGVIAVPVCLLLVLVIELVLWRRRKAARAVNDPV
ncbi:hypothetical protein GCM10009789_26880 [Kribbella sancticallisti]|uniref:Uncharacterized protein n=1 Tax=Kribbella sancticallisti TaxID=460087 RepID=A0ABP4P1R6_9ACTN